MADPVWTALQCTRWAYYQCHE